MFLKKLKSLIKKFDLFAQPVTFRYGDQPQYQSYTGGICSIMICIAFVIVFANAVLSTFRKDKIISSVLTMQQQDPSYYKVGTDSFMFAVGLSGIDLNKGDMWFDIYLEKRIYTPTNKNKSIVQLQECTKAQWVKINQNFSSLYDKLGFNTWLCPTEGTIIQLQGKFSSNMFKYYKFGIKQCNNTKALALNRTCVNSTNIQNFLNANQAFTFNFYYVNTILNPSSHQYIQHYLDDLNYFPFTPTDGMTANFFLSSYTINTDESIYPVQQPDQLKGGISTTPTQTIPYKIRQKDYLKLYIRKSSLSIQVQRSFGKIDDTLSYIGGLFSFIISAAMLLKIYNQFSYELEIAKNIYHYDKNQPIQSDSFNFFTFLGYLVFMIFQQINIKLPWKKMRMYDRSLQQVRKQMDIRLIMKKILYSERMAIAVFDQPKAKILHLQEPLTLQEAEQIRKDHRFYQKLAEKYFDYEKIRQDQKKDVQMEIFAQRKQQQSAQHDHSQLDLKAQEGQKKYKEPNSQASILLNQMFFGGQKQNNIQINNVNTQINLKSQEQSDQKPKIKSLTSEQQKNFKPFKQRLKQKQRRNTQRKKFKQLTSILNLVVSKEDQKKHDLDIMINNMRKNVKQLQKQAEQGDVVSQNILSRFDPKLMKMFVLSNQIPKSLQEKINQEKQKLQEQKKLKQKQLNDTNKSNLNRAESKISHFTVNLGIDETQIKIQTDKIAFEPSNKSIKQ